VLLYGSPLKTSSFQILSYCRTKILIQECFVKSYFQGIDRIARLTYLEAMSVRPIILLPDEKTLRQVSKPLKQVDDHARAVFDDMLETMYDAPGIGLAAIQIGVAQRMVVIDLAKEGEKKKPLFVANPEIVWTSEDESDYEEGCLSIPDFYEMVQRPKEVKVQYLDRKGEAQEIHATGLLATCLQHEIDHLNGVLFIDYISRLKRARVIKKFQKADKLGKL
jgi:peptide deformylase